MLNVVSDTENEHALYCFNFTGTVFKSSTWIVVVMRSHSALQGRICKLVLTSKDDFDILVKIKNYHFIKMKFWSFLVWLQCQEFSSGTQRAHNNQVSCKVISKVPDKIGSFLVPKLNNGRVLEIESIGTLHTDH